MKELLCLTIATATVIIQYEIWEIFFREGGTGGGNLDRDKDLV